MNALQILYDRNVFHRDIKLDNILIHFPTEDLFDLT